MISAALWMIGAIAAFTSMAIAGRSINQELDTFEIMLFRSIIGIAIVLSIAATKGTLQEVNARRILLHLGRNLAHFTGQNLWFFALPLVPLTQLFALEFTTPLWVIILSPIILRERLTAVGVLCAGLGFVGIMLVARPEAGPLGIGFFAAAGCAVFFALTAIFTRKLTETESITCILVYLTCMQAVFGLIMAGYDGDITLPDSRTLPWVILIGCAGLLAHFCLTKALSLAPASIVMPIDFARLPIIALIGAIFYAEPISIMVLAGAVLIFSANYVNITHAARN